MRNVAQTLRHAQALGVERLDARRLLAHVLGRAPAWLIAHDDTQLADADWRRIDALLQRRAAGEPLAYLVGEKTFHALALRVTPDVLVPRPETELLVEWALELLPGLGAAPAVLDLGTGSGAVALAVAHGWPKARVTAVDASAPALAVARANGERLGLTVEWLAADWYAALAGRRFDLVVSNPPYVAEGDPHLEALRHEPRRALTAGADGLDDLRRIVADAPQHLRAGGWLIVEHGHDQAGAVQQLMREHHCRDIATRTDLAGLPRCTAGRVDAGPAPEGFHARDKDRRAA
jgi:release factor glutamine methyltransferase